MLIHELDAKKHLKEADPERLSLEESIKDKRAEEERLVENLKHRDNDVKALDMSWNEKILSSRGSDDVK